MKKIALVAVLAAIAAPSFAQSSVTLWGRMNTTVESQETNGAGRVVAVQNNSSRLGVRGVEDLGGGLKAGFNLEHGLNSDDGRATGDFWNRGSHVQLIGSFGEVRLGRWTPGSYFATADYISMHNHDTGRSSDALYSGAGFTSKNKLGYFSPKYAGFSMEVALAAGEGVEARSTDLSAYYDQGPVHLGFGYSKQGTALQYALRGLYEMGAFTFGAYWQVEDTGVTTKGVDATRNIGRVSAMYAMGASEFHVNYGGTYSGGTQKFGAKQYTLGYNYNLSKRTKVYGFYTAIDSTDTALKGKMGDFSSLAAGVRHNF